jgi:hypothetical protein
MGQVARSGAGISAYARTNRALRLDAPIATKIRSEIGDGYEENAGVDNGVCAVDGCLLRSINGRGVDRS